ncbi:M23 family metallopeptidase [Corynebacterium guangdongense]|uniref:Murein DD-endopeptidase MepM/ murein hydrolase activator NlpD n=1 Tax=Corynebacterium guangdongense TaxID=1783348 RepID=A0ABU1ZXD8_9CORY|nr:M23 family metallopeptidase [Corynebacterium guangdongense]MDR7329599.1 murein DD-endopeptidase MepM/ murein hydrolase activator NlpD [Corynebacterium guangdongense]WJZ18164.1 Stage II sporulation protein Q [Corynebacterium guangdongense]
MRILLLASTFCVLALSAFAPAANAYVDPTSGEDRARAVLRAADIPAQNWLPGHRGVDLALAVGADVLAAADGVVAHAGHVAGMPVVSIEHPDGIRTTYQPVQPLVAAGDTVTEGQVIGRLGLHPGGDDGLHWGARTAPDTYLNPLILLARPTIRLKPL